MLFQDQKASALNTPSLSEIQEILALEYGEDIRSLSQVPHQWIIVQDHESGLIGGLCLTPLNSSPFKKLVPQLHENSNDSKGWVASHLFCWLPEHTEEGSKQEQQSITKFYQQLYIKLVEFCNSIGLDQLWTVFERTQYFCLSKESLFPFEKKMTPFHQQDTDYILSLLSVTEQAQHHFWQGHSTYCSSRCLTN